MSTPKRTVYVVLRRSPDVSPKLAEIMAVVSTREAAQRMREELCEFRGIKDTTIEEYAVSDDALVSVDLLEDA